MPSIDQKGEADRSCQMHTIDKKHGRCLKAQQGSRLVCAEHAAELDLLLVQACIGARVQWTVTWANESKATTAQDPAELARVLMARAPQGELDLSEGRVALALRSRGRVVAVVRWTKEG